LVSDIKEEYRLKVFENRMLRRLLETEKNEIIGSWIRLHNEKLHKLYSSENMIGMIKLGRMEGWGL
jgi:hypothetical protein